MKILSGIMIMIITFSQVLGQRKCGTEATVISSNIDKVTKKIHFPKQAKKKEIQGKVLVHVLIGEDGKYVKHIVKESPDVLFTQEVEKYLPELKFIFAKSAKTWVTIPFNFTIKKRKNNF